MNYEQKFCEFSRDSKSSQQLIWSIWCFLIFFRVTVEVPYNVTWGMDAGIWQASLHLDLDVPKLDIQMSSPDWHIMWIGFKKPLWGIHWCSIRIFSSLPPWEASKVLGFIGANLVLWPFFTFVVTFFVLARFPRFQIFYLFKTLLPAFCFQIV